MPLRNVENIEAGGAPARIVQYLKENGPATVSQMSEALDIPSGYASSTVTGLLKLRAIHRIAWVDPEPTCRDQKPRSQYAFGDGPDAEKPAPRGRPAARAKWAEKRKSQKMNYFGAGIGKVSSIFDLAGISGDRKDLDHDQTDGR